MTSHLASPAHADPPSSVLVETLAAVDDAERTLTAGRPRGTRWVRLDDALADDEMLARWLAATGASVPLRARTMFLASWLAALVIEPLARSVIRTGRAWTIAPEQLHVRPVAEGWFDGLAIDGATVLVGPKDPAARSSIGVRRLMTDAAVMDAAAEDAARFGVTVLAAVRRVGLIGAPAFWGALADTIASGFVYVASRDGGDVPAAFRDGAAFMDAIARHVSTGRAHPELVPVTWSLGQAHEVRRGTCCLWYQTQTEPDPDGEDYCAGCPRRQPEDQVRGWVTWLEETATERTTAGIASTGS